jgi:hypothetical protein
VLERIEVLLVGGRSADDSPVARALAAAGPTFAVRHAGTAEAAARLAGDADVALLDVTAAGLEDVARLRALARDLPIVTVAADDDPTRAAACLRAGAQDCLVASPKVLQPPVLARALRGAIERRRLLEALRAAEDRYQALVAHAVFGICTTDAAGRVCSANPALVRILGFASEDELLAASGSGDCFADAAGREAFLAAHAGLERVHGAEVTWRGRDGRLVQLRLTGAPLRGPDGALLGFELMVEDVTDRRALEEQFRQSQKMEVVGRLTGGIAHDLNNLLTIVIGSTELLAGVIGGGNAASRDALEDLRGAVGRAKVLVRKLLAFARRESRRVKPLDLVAHVTELAGLLRRLLREPIEVRIEAEPGLPAVRAEESALDQVLFNLATNAQDAMPEGGRLTLRVERGEGPRAVRLAVSDTGAGMDATTRAQAFEPFFTTKPPGEGTGLGLSTVRTIVTEMGGAVELESEPGRGTTVHVTLPADEGAAPAERRSWSDTAPRGTETILIVEDEEALRSVARRVLELHGYSVVLGRDGTEALEHVRARGGGVDLIVSDLVMPRLGGVQLYHTLRREGRLVPMLFVSGYSPGHLHEVADLPSDVPLVYKPWTPAELLVAIRGALDRRRPVARARRRRKRREGPFSTA